MSNINDDEREGYGDVDGSIWRNCAELSPGVQTQGNYNDLQKSANTISGPDEVKNIIDIT